ncbi:MAG TPA: VOC family protein [Candidatus Dormibacteraeota bacterium]|nr:VOC family protein [Methylomirabilota bacterium]HWN01477.1 VOC family protein [Candidatus Dormibacteraeota bacterium]
MTILGRGSAVAVLILVGHVMRVTELGHVSIFVRDLDASVGFYRDLLGLRETGRGKGGRMAFLSAGAHHHDVSLEVARSGGGIPPKGAPGLYHIAFCIGRSREALQSARDECLTRGLVPFGDQEGARTPCFCVRDPDGHEVELYVEVGPAGT